ncbi:hypothetical protein CN297_09390 [Bacillus cereus]|uniref:hypothetical protein n=1 Tax=Bacillus cereus TaxID=1396 RepID=UPI000BF55109|nr:hypothetical protein [Bacillus cereus]PFC53255.1 hypothetical protein CN297_09390 [Bacillus cereus]
MGRNPHQRPPYPHLWVTIGGSEGAVTGSNYDRIYSHINDFKSLFATQCSKEFGLAGPFDFNFFQFIYRDNDGVPLSVTAEEFNLQDIESQPQQLISLHTRIKNDNVGRDEDPNTNRIPPYSIVIVYLPGDYLDNDGHTVGYAFTIDGQLPYMIVLTDRADSNTFAHEIGHVLNYSNKDGLKYDPHYSEEHDSAHDNDTDRGHNEIEGNLMYYNGAGDQITSEQCEQFRQSKIILRPES